MTPLDLAHAATELALAPLDRLPEGAALVLVSILSGALALWAVKRTTDQERLATARDQLVSGVLEMRVFLDSPRRVLRAQGRVLEWTVRYVAAALPALLLLVIPFTLLFVHLLVRHEVAPLPVGEDVLLKVEVDPGFHPSGALDFEVQTPPEVELTAPVFTGEGPVFYARVRPTTPGRHVLRLKVGLETLEKLLVAGDPETVGRVTSPERRGGVGALWAFGVEAGLHSRVSRITIEHPPARRRWLGMPWWLVWLGLSVASALALRRPMGVVI